MEDYYKKDYAKIDISMDLTNIGINGFTHTIKNHIQGIKSETEYLAERYSTDEEVNMSTKLILESCDICFISIEYANKHLKNLNLTLKLIPIVNPIKLALDQMKSVDDKIEITYNERVGNTMAYIDEGAFRQVMINLILNAVEAIEEKNNGKIDLMIQEKGRWGMIQVIDNGKGIDE
ncbi:MAG TPA: sensor histidine kinase, partial [Candidatus Merdenecus merdavium]|nr:sensor histidine kinase [Candidatus Merdenecus merdavium]